MYYTRNEGDEFSLLMYLILEEIWRKWRNEDMEKMLSKNLLMINDRYDDMSYIIGKVILFLHMVMKRK